MPMLYRLDNGKYRVQVRRKGWPRFDKVFDSKKAAKDELKAQLKGFADRPLYTPALTLKATSTSSRALVFANRSLSNDIRRMLLARNSALWPIAIGTCVLLAAVLTVPVVRSAFHFSSLAMHDLATVFAAAVLSSIAFLLLKRAAPALRRHAKA
ncbi:MAG TPA: cation transporting ATPase C-terminal domain-containing protein [Burkholderiales bacterium]|nr:cation transporting ATPase C-terminal domain-containing protein [Burkholderiales bacterium]